MITYLTITGFGAHGNSGDKSFKEQLFWNERCQKGAEIVRKKFPEVFGTRMPRVRVSPLGPKCYKALLRFIAFFVCMERDSKNQITICRWHIAATSANTGGYLYLRLRCKCKRVSPLGPKVQNPLLRSLGFFSSLHKNSLSEKSYLVAVLCATRILLLRDSRKRDHLVVK